MSDIFEEVDESLRQDKIESLWMRYRPFIYGAAALTIGGVALNEFVLRPAAEKARAERALSLETAVGQLREGDYADAEAGLRPLAEGKAAMAPLAANFLAQTLYEGQGDAAAAANALSAVADAEGTPFQRLALIKAAYAKADAATLEELETMLAGVIEDDTAIGSLARELIAAKAYASGDVARARTEFNRLKFDAAAPEGVVRRAEIALAAIPAPPADAIEDDDDASPAESTPEPTEETGQ
ncbi:MAG: hypothetical protein KDA53_16500 [Hyphomonas sp.]|nr:hypothetical protein [Hyphomonas sp.]